MHNTEYHPSEQVLFIFILDVDCLSGKNRRVEGLFLPDGDFLALVLLAIVLMGNYIIEDPECRLMAG